MKIKSLPIIIVMGLLWAIFPLNVVVHAGTWSGIGPGAVTVLDGTTSNPQLDYHLTGTDCFSTQTWDFNTIADADGDIELHYLYEGFHAWYRVRVFANAYVTHNSVTTFTPLVALGPVNCCDYPSGWFDERGSVRLNVQAGDTYGFQFGGSHYTGSPEMHGTLIVLPAGLSPKEGTLGTEISITGSGFGTTKGKVLIGGVGTTIAKNHWSDTAINCTVTKVLPPGETDVTIMAKPYNTGSPMTIPRFGIRSPGLYPLSVNHGPPGEEITITGLFFGSKKGKVYMEYQKNDQVKKKSCKVTYWFMDPTTGASTLSFVVPKGLPPEISYPLWVTNKVGSATTSFTIDPLP